MNIIRLATATLNQTPLDWEGNFAHIVECLNSVRASGSTLLCLPELAIPGYGCEDQFLAPSTCEKALSRLIDLLPFTEKMAVCVGLPLRHQNAIYNTAALIADGELLGFYAKQNLAGDGLHYEPRWFRPWPAGKRIDYTYAEGKSAPLGDFTVDLGGVHLGFEICEDAWVADRPGRKYAELGVDLILNPSASHFAFGKQAVREQFVREGSRAFGVAYLYANLMGNESGRAIYDGGAVIASAGQVVARGPRFSYQPVTITTADVDLEINRLAQAKTVGRDVSPAEGPAISVPSFQWTHCSGPSTAPDPPHWSKEDEFTRAVSLGLFDYLRKSHSNGFVVSLSGGADSAAVACLIRLMRDLALADLSDEQLAKLLPHLGGMPAMKDLLFTAYQATSNSGETTSKAASTLAAALGAEHAVWNVQDAVDHYVAQAEKTLGRKLTWEADDITLQNIQAHVRAPGIWMMANIRNALLLATSNRSEAAVGYATMDGDTCGGLSPIAGIDKAFLRHWLRWLEREGSDEIPPLPALSVINAQQPTAELRPEDAAQTDEGDLMPFPVLDYIERLAIRDKKGPLEISLHLQGQFPDSHPQHKTWICRFFRLWARNQWKRERYAPSFHLDDENLDPKTWCRFPILSAGFEDELAHLESQVPG